MDFLCIEHPTRLRHLLTSLGHLFVLWALGADSDWNFSPQWWRTEGTEDKFDLASPASDSDRTGARATFPIESDWPDRGRVDRRRAAHVDRCADHNLTELKLDFRHQLHVNKLARVVRERGRLVIGGFTAGNVVASDMVERASSTELVRLSRELLYGHETRADLHELHKLKKLKRQLTQL